MSKYAAILPPLLMALVFTTCSSIAGADRSDSSFDNAVISARGAIGGLEAAVSLPMFEGDGGKDIRLAILAPEGRDGTPDYLPVYVQGLLNNNFSKYSAITVTERRRLDEIIANQNLGSNGRFSDADYVKIGGLTNAEYLLVGTIQKLSGGRYSLQLAVTHASTGEQRAFSMKDGLLSQIEGNGALINQAAAELLEKLGVRLSGAGRQRLLEGSAAAVKVEAGLARGITAQASGDSVEALFSYTQSIAFDPSRIEAVTRLSELSSSISGGTLSQRILNDMQSRDRWIAAFKESTRFFNEHPPFEISFDPNMIQEGESDYTRRTAAIAMRIALAPSAAGFDALNALLEGLEKTGRRDIWGFKGWPLLDIQPRTSGTVVFEGKRSFSFKVDITLLNERNKILGKSSVSLNSGELRFAAGDTRVSAPSGAFDMARFSNVKVDDLTPTLTIVISAVNGIPSRTLNAKGYMNISPGNLEELWKAGFKYVPGGTFTMGSPASEAERGSGETQHQVTVSSFYMGKYPVTQKEWREVMGTNPSSFKGDNLPVESVSWYKAVEYCNARSRKEGLSPAYTVSGQTVSWNRAANGYRLPTEAEWEYACRAGTSGPFNTGNNITTGQANYNGNYPYNNNAKGEYRESTTAVGSFAPNSWGLYDMHGNVWEWCWDWYGDYPSGAQTDPTGASSGSDRVSRGGGWSSPGRNLRSAYRGSYSPSDRGRYLGFRLVRP